MSEKEVRLIDAQQLYNCRTCRYHGRCDFIVTCDHGEMYSPDMSKLETIDPESLRPHGKWMEAADGDGVVCSVCGEDFCTMLHDTERFKFCPNCGAKMEG